MESWLKTILSETLMNQHCGFYNRVNNILDYDTRVISHIHIDGRWEATSADGAIMQFMPRPISPVEFPMCAMRLGQTMLVQEFWITDGLVEIQPAWRDSVEHSLCGDLCEFAYFLDVR